MSPRESDVASDAMDLPELDVPPADFGQFLLRVVDAAPFLTFLYDIVGERCLWVNQRVTAFLGYKPEEIRALPDLLSSLLHPDGYAQYPNVEPKIRQLTPDTLFEWEYRLRHRDGSYRWVRSRMLPYRFDEQGQVTQVIGFAEDVTERKSAEDTILWQASHDVLTGLLNRNSFRQQVRAALTEAESQQTCAAILFIDLDSFKRVNDALSHERGDALLRIVARRFEEALSGEKEQGALLARTGGDEFSVYLPCGAGGSEVETIANRLLATLGPSFELRSMELYLTGSIGSSRYPEDGNDFGTLLQKAEVSLYAAKSTGGGKYCPYHPELETSVSERLDLENHLRLALDRNEIRLAYQPLIDMATGQVTSVEALLRWETPKYGLISPDRFIPIAEETGLILPLGRWVLQEACRQAAAWRQEGLELFVSVNLSVRQLTDPNLVEAVQEVLRETGLEPQHLEFELTESVFLERTGASVQTIRDLKAIGIRLAIDDFGTGYSSLSYLKRLPLDCLKIDRSFVRDLAPATPEATNAAHPCDVCDPQTVAIVKGVIELAHALHLVVIAEGVETPEQMRCLAELGCDGLQGFLFSEPVPAEKIAALYQSAPFPTMLVEHTLESVP